MKLLSPGAGLIALSIVAVASLATAQILRVDLPQIVAKTDDAVFGTIVKKHVVRIDHPVDGQGLYFTTLSIEGRSLETQKPVTVDVSFLGGFVDPEHGSCNGEAPTADDTKIGNRVVCFYTHTENMGGDFAANEIFGWHGGIYRTFERNGNVIVQGRGEGYAISNNITVRELETQIAGAIGKK